MHWWRWRHHGTPETKPPGRIVIPAADRFWAKVEKTPTCWLWTASGHGGYGKFYVARDRPRVRAHRFSWELEHGPIPEGLDVLHECDTPPCVRPSHLFLGTDEDNVRDMIEKGRQNWGVPERAARLLTWELVDAMRADMAAGMSRARAARKYGVNHRTASNVALGRSWVRPAERRGA